MKKVLEAAEAEVGYQAIGSASKYFSELFPMRRSMPWCVSFIEWIFQEAYGKDKALEMLCLQKGGFIWSPQSLLTFFKHKNKWHRSNPEVGWLVFIRTNNEWTDHVELITDTDNNYITAIGGNCGGKVRKNIFDRNDIRISGYGEIIYEEDDDTCIE